jgi:hypothetical protein
MPQAQPRFPKGQIANRSTRPGSRIIPQEAEVLVFSYGLPALQAARTRKMVVTPENMTGTMKKYLQLKNVTTMKQIARPQVGSGIATRDSSPNGNPANHGFNLK